VDGVWRERVSVDGVWRERVSVDGVWREGVGGKKRGSGEEHKEEGGSKLVRSEQKHFMNSHVSHKSLL